jgi:superfamily II RNA helicase
MNILTTRISNTYLESRESNIKQNSQIAYDKEYSQYALENFLINKANFNKISFLGSINKPVEKPDDPVFNETIKKYYRFTPDQYQIDAARSIYDGSNTIVTAPTGSGKTLVAEYVINKNIEEGNRTFYTTPLKALSNQKLQDFSKLFGADNVGLVTGDFVYNENAPVIVMTTEVYRNKLLSKSTEDVANELKDVKTVIFDEFHYMNDGERGIVWEESIMHSPEHVQIVALSATIPNADNLAIWMERINQSNNVKVVTANPEDRHVPLRYFTFSEGKIKPLMQEYVSPRKLNEELRSGKMSEKKKEALTAMGEFISGSKNINQSEKNSGSHTVKKKGTHIKKINHSNSNESAKGNDKNKKLNNEGVINALRKEFSADYILKSDVEMFLKSKCSKTVINKALQDEIEIISNTLVDNSTRKVYTSNIPNNRVNPLNQIKDLIFTLEIKDMLPAIFFVFSKRNCNTQVENFVDDVKNSGGKSLLNKEEQDKVRKTIEEYQNNGVFLGADFNPDGLLLGVATHHAGMMPGYRDLVEKLFQQKLIKVVFATETLAAGINMPAKTTIITDLDKPTDSVKPDTIKIQNSNTLNLRDLTSTEMKQMTGRAGRRGIDSIGNVIILNTNMLDKAVEMIKNPPEPLISNFKPSYGYLSFFLEQNQTMDKLDEVIEKSFLNESSLLSKSKKANTETDKKLKHKDLNDFAQLGRFEKASQEIRNDFDLMKNVLLERGFIEPINSEKNSYNVTALGQLATKVRGVNEILLSELISNPELNKLTPEGLAAVVSTFIGNEKLNDDSAINNDFKYGNNSDSREVQKCMEIVKELSTSINQTQEDNKIVGQKIEVKKQIAPYIFMWANASKNNDPSNKEQCYEEWTNVVNALKMDKVMFYEGNFIRTINNTIDILNQIQKLSEYMKTTSEVTTEYENYEALANLAKQSATMLKNPPVKEIIWDYETR